MANLAKRHDKLELAVRSIPLSEFITRLSKIEEDTRKIGENVKEEFLKADKRYEKIDLAVRSFPIPEFITRLSNVEERLKKLEESLKQMSATKPIVME